MEQSNLEIKSLLRWEVIDRGRAPAFAFGIFAIFVFFYAFGCTTFLPIIRGASALVVLISFFRIKLINELKGFQNLTESNWNILRLNIWLNALCWSVILNVASYELQFSGVQFIVVTTILCGFISASLITLSADMSLFFPFQLLLLAPQIVFMSYDYFGENKYQLSPLIPVYVMYLLYQFKQVQEFKQKVIQNFLFKIDLEKTNGELKSSQDALINQTVKLIHTSRLAALGEMAAGIAHEVNNPLTVISGSLQQLERKIDRQDFSDTEILKKYTYRSQQSISRITKIIIGLRLFSQQSDSLPKVKVTIHQIVDDTLYFCAEMLKSRFVNLKIGTIPDAILECHPVQISQVLINLIKNAEDALIDEKDENERWVELVFEDLNKNILIHVSNGGPKINKEIKDKLFHPFFTTKGVGKGTGLGLSISQGIMKEHGGDLHYNDNEKQTSFTVTLLKV